MDEPTEDTKSNESKPKWRRMNLDEENQEKELQAAKIYLNLQSTAVNDRSIKEAMKRAHVEYSHAAVNRIRTKIQRMKKDIIPNDVKEDNKLPLVLHPKLQDRIRVRKLPKDICDDLEVVETIVKSKVTSPNQSDFYYIGKTNLKQWHIEQRFFSLFGKNKYDSQVKSFKNNLQLFITANALTDMGVLFDEIDMSLIYTASDEIVHQTPHFDYAPKVLTQKQIKDNAQFAWIMLLPLTSSGCWVTVWTGPGVGTNMQINFGECLFLRSDVVHAGGRREITNEDSDTKFVRLHCYLPTAFQKVVRDKIYTLNLNGLSLQDTYWVEDVPKVAASSPTDTNQNKKSKVLSDDNNNKIKQLNALMELLSDMKHDVANVGSIPIKIVKQCTTDLTKSLGK